MQSEGEAHEEEAHEEVEEEAREEEARQEDGYLQKQIAYRGAHVSLAVQPDAEHEEQAILHCAGVHVGLEGLNYELQPGRRCHLNCTAIYCTILLFEYALITTRETASFSKGCSRVCLLGLHAATSP